VNAEIEVDRAIKIEYKISWVESYLYN